MHPRPHLVRVRVALQGDWEVVPGHVRLASASPFLLVDAEGEVAGRKQVGAGLWKLDLDEAGVVVVGHRPHLPAARTVGRHLGHGRGGGLVDEGGGEAGVRPRPRRVQREDNVRAPSVPRPHGVVCLGGRVQGEWLGGHPPRELADELPGGEGDEAERAEADAAPVVRGRAHAHGRVRVDRPPPPHVLHHAEVRPVGRRSCMRVAEQPGSHVRRRPAEAGPVPRPMPSHLAEDPRSSLHLPRPPVDAEFAAVDQVVEGHPEHVGEGARLDAGGDLVQSHMHRLQQRPRSAPDVVSARERLSEPVEQVGLLLLGQRHVSSTVLRQRRGWRKKKHTHTQGMSSPHTKVTFRAGPIAEPPQ